MLPHPGATPGFHRLTVGLQYMFGTNVKIKTNTTLHQIQNQKGSVDQNWARACGFWVREWHSPDSFLGAGTTAVRSRIPWMHGTLSTSRKPAHRTMSNLFLPWTRGSWLRFFNILGLDIFCHDGWWLRTRCGSDIGRGPNEAVSGARVAAILRYGAIPMHVTCSHRN